jgi:four helix bundle protein
MPKSNDNHDKVKSYRDLIVWQKAMALAEAVYRVTATFPREEVYGLTSQMRCTAISVASHLAEG